MTKGFDKILPCGMRLVISQYGNGTGTIQAELINELPGSDAYASVGAFFPGGNKNHLIIFVSPDSLPALREALDAFSPAPRKWYEFWK